MCHQEHGSTSVTVAGRRNSTMAANEASGSAVTGEARILQVLDDETDLVEVVRSISEGEAMAEKDAFYVVDLGDIVRKHLRWLSALPRVRPFYAVKCNNTQTIVHTLATLGVGFDCASKEEIALVQSLGVSADRIIYANPCKQASHLRYAANYGVDLMTFDSDAELHKVARINPNARLVLRIVTNDSRSVHKMSNKFGVSLESSRQLLETAFGLGLLVVGVSFHVGSICNEPETFARSIADARRVFNIAAELGVKLTLLDIGGGFPGYNEHVRNNFDEIVAIVNLALDTHFPAGCGVNIISEPGRYYVMSAFTLATNVIAKKTLEKPLAKGAGVGEPVYMYYMNDGIFGSFNLVINGIEEVVTETLKHVDPEEPVFESSLWGPTCDGQDCVMERTQLPEMHVGDWLLFRNMGAYSMAMFSEFNGFCQPKLYYVIRKTEWTLLTTLCPEEQLSQFLGFGTFNA
ncbi:ornithine decarboxylase-like [Lampetra fluviatilis]